MRCPTYLTRRGDTWTFQIRLPRLPPIRPLHICAPSVSSRRGGRCAWPASSPAPHALPGAGRTAGTGLFGNPPRSAAFGNERAANARV